MFVAISESLGRAWVMKAFCWTRAGAAAKGNKAAVFSSSSSETTQKICRGIWAKGCSRAFAFQFLFCVLPISISFSITLGRIFQSWLKQCARTRFCFCGHLSLTAVDLLHSFLQALIFSPPVCHVNLFLVVSWVRARLGETELES